MEVFRTTIRDYSKYEEKVVDPKNSQNEITLNNQPIFSKNNAKFLYGMKKEDFQIW
jgi:hypothetical protein